MLKNLKNGLFNILVNNNRKFSELLNLKEFKIFNVIDFFYFIYIN